MSIKHGSNRFFPRAGDGGGGVVPPGAGLWSLYGGTVVGLTDITETVAIGDTAMLSDETLLVRGGITSAPTGAGNDAFLETGANDASVFSDPSSIRIIYNSTSMQAEISTNGGAYVPLASGGASPWTAGGGAITEVNPANLVIVGSGAALTAQQFQVLGESYFKPAADSATVVQVVNAAGSTLLSLDTTDSAVLVGGTVAPVFGAGFVGYQVEVQSDASGSGLSLRSADPALAGNLLSFVESRGTVAAPTSSLSLDVLGTVAFTGYGSDDVLDSTGAVVIQASVDGNPDLGYVPGRIDIGTKPDGGAGPTVPRFTIRGTGFVGVNQTTPVVSEVFGVTGDAYVSGKLTVEGDIDPLSVTLSGSTALYYDSDDGSTAPVSAAGHGRLRFVSGTGWQASVDGGAYYTLITTNTLPSTAFVQGGNSFGAAATLGTNDAHNLQFEVNNTTLARLTTTNQFLVGLSYTVPTSNEVLSVAGGILSRPTVGGLGDDSYLQIGDGSGVAVGTAASARFRYNAGVAQVSLNGAAYVDLITSSSLPTNAFVQGGNAFGAVNVLGSTDNFALTFITNNTEKGRFATGGALLVGTTSATSTELLNVAGSAYVQAQRLTSATGYFESVASTAAVSNATEGRLRYSNANLAWQVSVNGGAYSNLLTAASLGTTAFLQGGNAFGATAVLGTTDGNALTFITSNTEKGRLTTGGAFLVGATSTTYGELFNVTQSTAGSASAKASAYLTSSVTTTDSGGLTGATRYDRVRPGW